MGIDPRRPVDDKVETTRTPRFKLFNLSADNVEMQEDYEELMDSIGNGKKELIQSSSNWHEGEYRVAVHYYDVSKKKVPRKDTDFESGEKIETQKSTKPETVEKSESISEETTKERNEAMTFDDGGIQRPAVQAGDKEPDEGSPDVEKAADHDESEYVDDRTVDVEDPETVTEG